MSLIKKKTLKKAVAFSAVVTLIIALVAGILLIGIGYTISKKTQSSSAEKSCLLSIFAADKATQASKGLLDLNLQCPANEVLVKKSDVVINGKIQSQKIEDIFIRELAGCYQKTGSAKLDPFRDYYLKQGGGQTVCLIC